jgi:hypothetical protein
MTAGSDIPARSTKTGSSKSASLQPAYLRESVLKTLLSSRTTDKPARRLTPEDIHARLILIIGASLAACFVLVTLGITYALIFVTQPLNAQAPNDAAFIDLLKTLAIFLTGSLGGVLAGNGLKSKPKPDTPPKP